MSESCLTIFQDLHASYDFLEGQYMERLECQVELDAVDKEVPPPSSYRGTSLIRNTSLLGPYSRTILRVIW